MRGASKVTLQPHQILRLPRKMNVIDDLRRMAVGQKSWTKNLILGGHNRHFYMILHFRYVASRKEIPQNTS